MIKQPSQQREYTLIFSGDPALNLPSLASIENLPESEQPTARLERSKALEVAWETGRWDALLITGESPTVFHVQPLGGIHVDYVLGERDRERLTNPEVNVLALRLALRKIEGFGGHKVELERVDGHVMASMDTVAALYEVPEVGREIVQELGSVISLRMLGALRPKS